MPSDVAAAANRTTVGDAATAAVEAVVGGLVGGAVGEAAEEAAEKMAEKIMEGAAGKAAGDHSNTAITAACEDYDEVPSLSVITASLRASYRLPISLVSAFASA